MKQAVLILSLSISGLVGTGFGYQYGEQYEKFSRRNHFSRGGGGNWIIRVRIMTDARIWRKSRICSTHQCNHIIRAPYSITVYGKKKFSMIIIYTNPIKAYNSIKVDYLMVHLKNFAEKKFSFSFSFILFFYTLTNFCQCFLRPLVIRFHAINSTYQ